MRWFFLASISLLAAAGNAAIFESISVSRTIGGVAFNLFILSLAVVWRASYFSANQAKERLLVFGHATLMLATGVGIFLIGTNLALANSCESVIFGTKPHGLLSQFAIHLQRLGYCRELGFGVVIFGLFMAYPSVRLFIGMTHRSGEPHSAVD